MIIQAATFKATQESDGSDGLVEGTVQVVLGRETKEVSAFKCRDRIFARGFGGRYQTGSKVWPATVILDVTTGNESALFGRDDRSGRFNKLAGVFLL